jgi:hypothetical protein
MTRHTNPHTVVPDPRTCIAALAVATIAFGLLLAGAGVTTAQTGQPTVSVSSATATVDDTTTVDVVLTEAPDGLSGYYLDLTVDNPEVATVTSASYSDEFGLTTDPTIDTDGQTVTLEAADIEGSISPGATDVTLATVEVASQAAGEVELTVEPQQFDTNDGGRFRPETQPGVLTIGEGGNNAADSGSAGGNNAADSGSAGSNGAGASEAGSGAGSGAEGNDRLGGGFSGTSIVLVGAALVAIGSLAAVAVARRRS